jgi:two-component system, sensor histidine kinase
MLEAPQPMIAFGTESPPPHDGYAERMRIEQVAALYGYILIGVLGALVGGIVLNIALYYVGSVPLLKAAGWVAFASGCTLFHLALRHFYWRSPRRDEDRRFWARWFTIASVLDGLGWGWATVFLVGPNQDTEQYLVLLVAFAVASGSVPALGSYLPAFYAILFPIALPILFKSLMETGALHQATAVLDVVYIVTMVGLAQRTNENFLASLRLRFEKDALAEKLRIEKERAEEANLAKSRFLASASHDLRQPIHALGMFLGALSQHEMDDEMRRLVEHMEGSVNAMDSLFGSLLDISRLDAGVVQSHPQSFPIDSLLERICRDQMGEAAEKGLRLVYCPCSLSVFTDPILLERILRNIISNAVRYTDEGRVVVGCRRGRRLRIEVRDSGRGIPQDQQDRVFEEFYQLGNPERDRAKGLGLGLAIVKRLTVILACPFGLTSRPGKGTTFTLSVPIANATTFLEQPLELPQGALRRGLILVVDDEATIREAMRVLLTGWGHQVIIGGSGDEVLAQLADCPIRPDLIVCDYRLRAGENGIDVIRRLQSEYNEDIPAVLITGDTAPDRLAEAKSSGFLLLHKPVSNVKLRATIGHLMSAPEVESD